MGTLLNRRRYMGGQKQEKVLFELYNQYFDGTASSVVDTGLKLWDGTHNRWKMEVVYQSMEGLANYTTLFAVRPDYSAPYSGIRSRKVNNAFSLTISEPTTVIYNSDFTTTSNAFGNHFDNTSDLSYNTLTIIRDNDVIYYDYNGHTITILMSNPKTNNLNLLIGCDYKGANNETQRYFTGTIQKFVISELGDFPYEAELEYLESTGTQWIDTGIYPDTSYTFDSEVWITKASGETVLWGVRKSGAYNSDNQQCMLDYPNYSGYYFIGLFSTNTSGNENWKTDFRPETNVKYSLVGMTVVSTMQTMTFPVHLFGFNNKGSAYPSIGACRLGEWVAYSNGVVVADFIPVRVGTVGYMYDKVSGNLFGNSGTGDFILGPDKT